MVTTHDLTPDQFDLEMEAAWVKFERWRNIRRRARPSETPSEFDGCRTEEDDRLDGPQHGGV